LPRPDKVIERITIALQHASRSKGIDALTAPTGTGRIRRSSGGCGTR
jgi:hypothetical protein